MSSSTPDRGASVNPSDRTSSPMRVCASLISVYGPSTWVGEDDLLLGQLVPLERRLRGGAGRLGQPDRQGRVGLAVLGVVLEDAARTDGCQTLAPHTV